MQITRTDSAATEPVQPVRRAAPRTNDPGEAGRQRKARRKIECNGGRESLDQPTLGRGAKPSREIPRHNR